MVWYMYSTANIHIFEPIENLMYTCILTLRLKCLFLFVDLPHSILHMTLLKIYLLSSLKFCQVEKIKNKS